MTVDLPTTLDFNQIEGNASRVVEAIGEESVAVYTFLLREFAAGPVTQNFVFQFLYRSYYRLDNAGLTPDFKREYFRLMERHRGASEIALDDLLRSLYEFEARNGKKGLQFSFVTKLANTINPKYPIYDSEVAKVFGFRPPYATWTVERRIAEYLGFYAKLRESYESVINRNLLEAPRRMFRDRYAKFSESIHEIKVLDFIFWSAGKQLY